MAKPQQRVLEWNGKDVPKTLRSLPEGRYLIEDVAPSRKLSAIEDAGLQRALESVREGRTVSAAKAHSQLRALIRRGASKKRQSSLK